MKWPLTNIDAEPEEDGFRVDYQLLAQASCGRINRTADGFAGYEKLNSPVLLPTGGVIVGGYRQTVAETSRRNRIRRHSFSHKVVAHGFGTILRQGLIHGVAAHIVGVAADFNV